MLGYILIGLGMFMVGVLAGYERRCRQWGYDRYLEGYRDGVHGRTLKRNIETY